MNDAALMEIRSRAEFAEAPHPVTSYWFAYHDRRELVRLYDALAAERDEYKIWWERDSTSLGKVIGDLSNVRAVAEDRRAALAVAIEGRDALAAEKERQQLALLQVRTALGLRRNSNDDLLEVIGRLRAALSESRAALYGALEVCGSIGNIQHAIDLAATALQPSVERT